MKRDKIIFYVVTGLFSLMMVMSAGMYLFNYDEVTLIFASLGFPAFVVYPLAVAKLAGVATIWLKPTKWLVEWAYAGFFFDFLLAGGGHLVAKDGEFGGAVIALVLMGASYFFYKRTSAAV